MLIRQYLKHGFYLKGTNQSHHIKTSSYGLKAILINIARPILGDPDKSGYGFPDFDFKS